MQVLDLKSGKQDFFTEELEELYSLSTYFSSLSKLNNSM